MTAVIAPRQVPMVTRHIRFAEQTDVDVKRWADMFGVTDTAAYNVMVRKGLQTAGRPAPLPTLPNWYGPEHTVRLTIDDDGGIGWACACGVANGSACTSEAAAAFAAGSHARAAATGVPDDGH